MADDDKNPIKKAVALHYDAEKGTAPRVAAVGAGPMAERILALAQEAGVDLVEDPDLIEVLARLPVGESIPPELFQAVAEILIFIYQMNQEYAEEFSAS